MKKNGFTLIELLAVVVIVSLLVIIVLPKITNSVKNFTHKTDKLTMNMIEDAAKLYIEDNVNDFPKNVNNSYCVTINELIDDEYLKESIEYDGKNIASTKSLQIIYSDDYDIEVVDRNDCIDYRDICKPVTEETKTTGNIPEGNLAAGDEYICEVKPGTQYHFFVLSTDENKVNLILDRNINSDGTLATTGIMKIESTDGVYNKMEWISHSDYGCLDGVECATNEKGPLTALKFLNKATKTWISLPNINEKYTDENIKQGTNGENGSKGYGTIVLKGKARLPKQSELYGTGKCLYSSENNGEYRGGCPLWLSNYLVQSKFVSGEGLKNLNEIWGYWLLSSSNISEVRVLYINFEGFVGYHDAYHEDSFGVRPVITLPKNYLVN